MHVLIYIEIIHKINLTFFEVLFHEVSNMDLFPAIFQSQELWHSLDPPFYFGSGPSTLGPGVTFSKNSNFHRFWGACFQAKNKYRKKLVFCFQCHLQKSKQVFVFLTFFLGIYFLWQHFQDKTRVKYVFNKDIFLKIFTCILTNLPWINSTPCRLFNTSI